MIKVGPHAYGVVDADKWRQEIIFVFLMGMFLNDIPVLQNYEQ